MIQIMQGRFGQNVRLDNLRVRYCNFSGVENSYNKEGDRNFNIIIDNFEDANALLELGLNVKPDVVSENPDECTWKLKVNVKYRTRAGKKLTPPDIQVLNYKGQWVSYDEETIDQLDHTDIERVTVVLNLWKYEEKKNNTAAYVSEMAVYPRNKMLADILGVGPEEDGDEVPFG